MKKIGPVCLIAVRLVCSYGIYFVASDV